MSGLGFGASGSVDWCGGLWCSGMVQDVRPELEAVSAGGLYGVALAQWVEREGADRPVPRGHSEGITVDGQTEPVVVKLGVWVSNTRTRCDKLTAEQLAALRELGMQWA